ncbi:MAG: hypothetical protein ACLT8E_10495 [Akkermansia sp.]
MKNLLGGKGANRWTRIGLPVPPGFTITRRSALTTTIGASIAQLDADQGRHCQDGTDPGRKFMIRKPCPRW